MRKTLLQLAKERPSIRRFGEETIDLDRILKILEVDRHAPSGINMQPWIYIVITDAKLKKMIRRDAKGWRRACEGGLLMNSNGHSAN